MIRRKNLSRLTALFVVATLFCSVAQAQPVDDELYGSALKVILKDNKDSPQFVIWDQSISSKAITTARLPNQEPYWQFQRSFPGLGTNLENMLVSINSDASDRKMPAFRLGHPAVPFSGFVDRASLRQEESQNKHSKLVIGFSKIAYAPNGRDAILYAEECSAGADDYCNANGFWFARSGGKWHLKKSAGFWGGPVKPFWNFD